jgi:hypothetical protein
MAYLLPEMPAYFEKSSMLPNDASINTVDKGAKFLGRFLQHSQNEREPLVGQGLSETLHICYLYLVRVTAACDLLTLLVKNVL